MPKFKHIQARGGERIGLAMILASLVAITLIVVTLLWHQKGAQETLIHSQGLSLARTLAGFPYEQLVPHEQEQSLLTVTFQSQNDPNFAYAAIIDTNNKPLSLAAAPGVTVPSVDWPAKPVGWLAERRLTTSGGDNILEFYSPLYVGGSITAYLRIGYFLPDTTLSLDELPLFATLALIIFLLTPLFYLMVRKEVKPLQDASEKIGYVLESQQFDNDSLQAKGGPSDFSQRFNTFVEFTTERINQLESRQEELQTSKKLISYSRSRIENVLEAIPEAVLILDQSGSISYGNRRVSTLLGVPADEIIEGDPARWCNDPEILDVIAKYSGQPSASYLSETVRLDLTSIKRQRKNLAIKAYPLFSPTDATSIYGTLIIFRDVTKESAAQRQQGEFIAHVAHELKTPLNTLALCAEQLLDDQSKDSEGQIEAANIIHDEVERLAGLIDNLLSVTKIEMGEISVERQRLRLHDFLQDTFTVASRSDKASELTFELDLPPDASSIMADKELLRIAINNLLTNAVKYSRPGGVVSMGCEETEQTVRISVRDTGIGIDPDEQTRIFDRFYRSENAEARQRTGHGLGLALARDIVQLHHGTLSVTSTPNEGSEFVIEIWKEAGLLKQVI